MLFHCLKINLGGIKKKGENSLLKEEKKAKQALQREE
jgi:hypothetical protein